MYHFNLIKDSSKWIILKSVCKTVKNSDDWPSLIFLQFAVYVLVQTHVFSAVFSRSVQIDQSPPRTTFHEVVPDVPGENDSEEVHSGAMPTESLEDISRAAENESNLDLFLSRFKRRSTACVLRKRIKWNHCLGRRFLEIRCRRQSVTCLSRDNIPPKCKKHMKIVFGERGGCPVVRGCTCAAWRHQVSCFILIITRWCL